VGRQRQYMRQTAPEIEKSILTVFALPSKTVDASNRATLTLLEVDLAYIAPPELPAVLDRNVLLLMLAWTSER